MRRLLICVVVVLASTPHVIVGQQRTSPVPVPRPLPAPSGHSTPASGSRVNTLILRGGPVSPLATPFRGNRHAAVFALPFFWGWSAPAFYLDARTQLLAPSDAPKGGVQLDVTPWRSQVYVDGMLMGRVDDFRGYYHPLQLAAGPHQFMIVDNGRQPLIFELTVIPGRTTTYRATLDEALGL